MRISRVFTVVSAVAFMIQAGPAMASFEKSTPFSGKYAGVAGATSANVAGSQSLFTNPAGLATGAGTEATLNFSPSWIEFRGPVLQANDTLATGKQFIPYGSLSVSYGITPQWTIGAGFATIGGSRALYSALDFSKVLGPTYVSRPDLESKISITEASLGTAYEVVPGLKFGADWRVTMVNGRLSLPSVTQVAPGQFAVANLIIDDMKTTNYGGFRFGGQYASEDKSWGVGASWRTAVNFVAKGQSSAKTEMPPGGTVTETTGGEATVAATLPNRIALGAYTAGLVQKFTLIGDAVWTEYGQTKDIAIAGTLPAFGPTASSYPATNLALNWQNIWSFRLGGEYTGFEGWAVRAGYAISTQGTPSDSARPTGVAPGMGHAISLGAGTKITDALNVDVAAEYSFASGVGTAPATLGDYSSTAMSLHTGASYRF